MIRLPNRLATAWDDAPEGAVLGTLTFTKGGGAGGNNNGAGPPAAKRSFGFGNVSNVRAIFSAALFFAPFLLFAAPVVIMSPILRLHVKVLLCGGPVSLICSHSILRLRCFKNT